MEVTIKWLKYSLGLICPQYEVGVMNTSDDIPMKLLSYGVTSLGE